MEYIRLCEGLKDKGTLIPSTEDIFNYIDDVNKDYYTSVYLYSEENKQRFDERNSVAGIRDVKTTLLVFDFDDEDNTESAREDAVELVDRLNEYGVEDRNIETYFSGAKGFHVIVNTQQKFDPKEAKSIARKLADGLPTFDSCVYNSNRIFRVPGTKHPKTDLYKIQLEPTALRRFSMKQIKDYAQEPRNVTKKESIHLPPTITELKEYKTKNKDVRESKIVTDIDLENKPKFLSPWKYALSLGYFPVGQRSNALDILARTYKANGFAQDQTFYLLKSAAEAQSERFDAEEFDEDDIQNNIINQVYGPNNMGGTYAEENFPVGLQEYLEKELGIPRMTEDKINIFSTNNDMFGSFRDFAKNIEKNTIKTGIAPLDNKVRMTTGMLCGLLGAPSSGKTSVSLDILRNVSQGGESALFYSMDMGDSLVCQRMAQKVTNYESERIFEIFKKDDHPEQADIAEKITEQFSNIDYSFKTALNVEEIYSSIKYYEQKNGKKVRLVVIDYLECINESISDPTAKISNIAQKLKDLANDLKVCVLLLLQPPKRVGDPSKSILSYTDIKGAATVGQACSTVISIWRDGFSPETPEHDRYMSFGILKNRFGLLGQVDCSFNGRTGEVEELDAIGKVNLQQLRDTKNEDDDDKGFF